jgi:hypothetical protein
VRDLNSELFSARLDTEDREPLKVLARLLVSEAVRDREPDRDLNRELFSARLETEPSEPVKALPTPLT